MFIAKIILLTFILLECKIFFTLPYNIIFIVIQLTESSFFDDPGFLNQQSHNIRPGEKLQ